MGNIFEQTNEDFAEFMRRRNNPRNDEERKLNAIDDLDDYIADFINDQEDFCEHKGFVGGGKDAYIEEALPTLLEDKEFKSLMLNYIKVVSKMC